MHKHVSDKRGVISQVHLNRQAELEKREVHNDGLSWRRWRMEAINIRSAESKHS